MSNGDPPGKDGLLGEGAAWFARMRGPDAEASRAEFEAWLARGALHRAAYNRAAEIFALGKYLADDPDIAALRRKSLRQRRVAVAAAALLLVVAGSWLALRTVSFERSPVTPPSQNPGDRLAQAAQLGTAAGEQSVRLADGSLVRMQNGTRLAVDITRAVRRLVLQRGNARFYVAHEQRPFLVYAGGGYVIARGTIFDVAYTGEKRVTVRLIQGVVDVTPPAAASAKSVPRLLHAGESLSFAAATAPGQPTEGGAATGVQPAGTAEAHNYDSISVADLVRLANRGALRPIRIDDPAIGQLRVSGRFRIDDTGLLAERIAALFDLVADPHNRSEIVLRPK